jgi:predicted acyltransferase
LPEEYYFDENLFNPLLLVTKINLTVMTQPTTIAQRLYSLDALRGFDMFWIMGAEEIVNTLAKATGSPFLNGFAEELTHPAWNGFHFYDLIFPLFLFIAGVQKRAAFSFAGDHL